MKFSVKELGLQTPNKKRDVVLFAVVHFPPIGVAKSDVKSTAGFFVDFFLHT